MPGLKMLQSHQDEGQGPGSGEVDLRRVKAASALTFRLQGFTIITVIPPTSEYTV